MFVYLNLLYDTKYHNKNFTNVMHFQISEVLSQRIVLLIKSLLWIGRKPMPLGLGYTFRWETPFCSAQVCSPVCVLSPHIWQWLSNHILKTGAYVISISISKYLQFVISVHKPIIFHISWFIDQIVVIVTDFSFYLKIFSSETNIRKTLWFQWEKLSQ